MRSMRSTRRYFQRKSRQASSLARTLHQHVNPRALQRTRPAWPIFASKAAIRQSPSGYASLSLFGRGNSDWLLCPLRFLKKTKLHEYGVEPAPELEANVFQQPRVLKPEEPVQVNRGLVAAVADDSNHLTHAARPGRSNQSGHQ